MLKSLQEEGYEKEDHRALFCYKKWKTRFGSSIFYTTTVHFIIQKILSGTHCFCKKVSTKH